MKYMYFIQSKFLFSFLAPRTTTKYSFDIAYKVCDLLTTWMKDQEKEPNDLDRHTRGNISPPSSCD